LSDLTLYKDRELTDPFGIEDLGDVEAGDVKTINGWLYNKTDFDIIGIEVETLDMDVEVTGLPESLDHRSSKVVTIKYSPSELRVEALNTYITFRGKKRIPPE